MTIQAGIRSADKKQSDPLFLIIFCVSLILRFLFIGQKTIWLDESFSIWLAEHSFMEMMSWIIHIDKHPPLYYILLQFCIRLFGTGEAAVRSLSAIAGSLSLPFFYYAVKRFFNRPVALISVLMLGLSPFHIEFAQEARMYSLVTLWTAGSLFFLSHILIRKENDRPAGIFVWSMYSVFQALIMMTHNIGAVFYPLAVNAAVFLLFFLSRKKTTGSFQGAFQSSGFLKNWILAQAGSLLIWLPWAGPFFKQAVALHGDFWLEFPDLHAVYYTLQTFNFSHLPRDFPFSWLWNFLFFGLALTGIWSLRKNHGPLLIIGSLFFVPFLGELAASLIRPMFLDRTLIWATLGYYSLIGAGLFFLAELFRKKGGRAGMIWPGVILGLGIALLIGLNIRGLVGYYFHYHKEDWKSAAEYVEQNISPSDLIIFNATWTQIPFEYYYSGSGETNKMRGLPVDLFKRGILEPKMTSDDIPYMIDLLKGRKRVCLVYSHNWFTDPDDLIRRVLEHSMIFEKRQRFGGMSVSFYQKGGRGWNRKDINDWLEPVRHDFNLEAPWAETVSVIGPFTDWLDEQLVMEKDDQGIWRASADLPKGRSIYAFYINGSSQPFAMHDPVNPLKEPNPWGFTNSILILK